MRSAAACNARSSRFSRSDAECGGLPPPRPARGLPRADDYRTAPPINEALRGRAECGGEPPHSKRALKARRSYSQGHRPWLATRLKDAEPCKGGINGRWLVPYPQNPTPDPRNPTPETRNPIPLPSHPSPFPPNIPTPFRSNPGNTCEIEALPNRRSNISARTLR